MRINVFARMALCGVCLSFVFGCQSGGPSGPKAEPLRVGVTPDYPPMVFRQDGRLTGAEVDMAQRLGAALGRPVEFYAADWAMLTDELLSGKVDMIMAGLSVTEARKVRMAFSDPYFETGLVAMMRRQDMGIYTNAAAVLACDGNIGVQAGTTGDEFVQQHCRNARRIALSNSADAAYELKRRRINLFIDDGPSVAWLISASGSTVGGLREPLTKEKLAWGFRVQDEALRDDVNKVLAGWKQDGTLNSVLHRWMPYLQDEDK